MKNNMIQEQYAKIEWQITFQSEFLANNGTPEELQCPLVNDFSDMGYEQGMSPEKAARILVKLAKGICDDADYVRQFNVAFRQAGGSTEWMSHDGYRPSMMSYYLRDIDPVEAGQDLAATVAGHAFPQKMK